MTKPKEKRPQWLEDMTDRLASFLKQRGTCNVCIVPAWCLDKMMIAADAGEKNAQSALVSIASWGQLADGARASGVLPACGGCEAVLDHGTISGWGILNPTEGDTGVVVPYCSKCIQRDDVELIHKLIELIEEETGRKMAMVQ